MQQPITIVPHGWYQFVQGVSIPARPARSLCTYGQWSAKPLKIDRDLFQDLQQGYSVSSRAPPSSFTSDHLSPYPETAPQSCW